MTDKEVYSIFCDSHPELPLFLQPWWLDAVTLPDGKEWEVLLARNKQGKIEAVLPFVTGSKWGMRYVLTPQLTQYTGVWIADKAGESMNERLSREKKLQTDLIGQLEAMKPQLVDLKFAPAYTNWLPFYWAGYQQDTRYTYRIEDLRDIEKVYEQIDPVKKRHIRAAEKELEVRFDMPAQDFYRLQCLQCSTRRQANVTSEALVTRLIDTAREKNQGFVVSAGEPAGEVHAAYFIPYDGHMAYELISAIHPNHRTSGGSVLALWYAIKKASELTKAFDFEGSMIEGVEHNNRQFGGTQTPYFHIFKRNKLIDFLDLCKK